MSFDDIVAFCPWPVPLLLTILFIVCSFINIIAKNTPILSSSLLILSSTNDLILKIGLKMVFGVENIYFYFTDGFWMIIINICSHHCQKQKEILESFFKPNSYPRSSHTNSCISSHSSLTSKFLKMFLKKYHHNKDKIYNRCLIALKYKYSLQLFPVFPGKK